MNPVTKICNFVIFLLLVSIPLSLCAPVQADSEDLSPFGFPLEKNQGSVFGAPEKKWSRLEPSIRFFKRSGNFGDFNGELVLLGTA
ncbi:hypothetical protein FO519_008048 [Halicephalobus sp. NKZ332]|nr:hypothetical protein FO519_008048 [Halicephalobus sp. NKZ332]